MKTNSIFLLILAREIGNRKIYLFKFTLWRKKIHFICTFHAIHNTQYTYFDSNPIKLRSKREKSRIFLSMAYRTFFVIMIWIKGIQSSTQLLIFSLFSFRANYTRSEQRPLEVSLIFLLVEKFISFFENTFMIIFQ